MSWDSAAHEAAVVDESADGRPVPRVHRRHLRRYQKLLATRLHDMVRERGFTGSVRTLREHVAL
ncbi:MAG: hypothetical protein HS111_22730 [Kofleriaceae bacterium]|nr:hypothetical protein [Kofleriaceae bacterium]